MITAGGFEIEVGKNTSVEDIEHLVDKLSSEPRLAKKHGG
jgi:hypothetical protein